MTGSRVTAIVLGLLVALLVFSFFRLYERVEETIDTGYSEEALRNPYLAAKQYLAALDRDAETSTEMALIDALEPGATIFITNASTVRSEVRVQQLLDWVDGGGRLILAVNEDDVTRNRGLVSDLGMEVEFIPAAHPKFESCSDLTRDSNLWKRSGKVPDSESIGEMLEEMNEQINSSSGNVAETGDFRTPEMCLDKKYQTKMEFTNIKEPFFIHFPGSLGLSWEEESSIEPFYFAEDDAGIRFAQMDWGGGLISILTSAGIWRSDRIGMFDNAYLMWTLSENNSRFHILYGSSMPSLLVQIWRTGYEFVLASFFALILWIWYVGKRVQPLRDPEVINRRSVLEHLEARGDYLWKNTEYDALITPLREDILQRCKLLMPAFYQASIDQQVEIISSTCNLELANVKQLFSSDSCDNAAQCQQVIRIAQQIRNRL